MPPVNCIENLIHKGVFLCLRHLIYWLGNFNQDGAVFWHFVGLFLHIYNIYPTTDKLNILILVKMFTGQRESTTLKSCLKILGLLSTQKKMNPKSTEMTYHSSADSITAWNQVRTNLQVLTYLPNI